MKNELNSLSSDRMAVNGLSRALKAGSGFRPKAYDSTQQSTRSLPKTIFSLALEELENMLVGARNHAILVGSHRTDQECTLSESVDEQDAIAVIWFFLEISTRERPDGRGPPRTRQSFG